MVVVLPTPPFWFATVKMRVVCGRGSALPRSRARRAVRSASSRARGVDSSNPDPRESSAELGVTSVLRSVGERPLFGGTNRHSSHEDPRFEGRHAASRDLHMDIGEPEATDDLLGLLELGVDARALHQREPAAGLRERHGDRQQPGECADGAGGHDVEPAGRGVLGPAPLDGRRSRARGGRSPPRATRPGAPSARSASPRRRVARQRARARAGRRRCRRRRRSAPSGMQAASSPLFSTWRDQIRGARGDRSSRGRRRAPRGPRRTGGRRGGGHRRPGRPRRRLRLDVGASCGRRSRRRQHDVPVGALPLRVGLEAALGRRDRGRASARRRTSGASGTAARRPRRGDRRVDQHRELAGPLVPAAADVEREPREATGARLHGEPGELLQRADGVRARTAGAGRRR